MTLQRYMMIGSLLGFGASVISMVQARKEQLRRKVDEKDPINIEIINLCVIGATTESVFLSAWPVAVPATIIYFFVK